MAKSKVKIPPGRPSKYKKKYCKMLVDFFSIARCEKVLESEVIWPNGKIDRKYRTLAAGLPTINKFATKINVWPAVVWHWANDVYPDDYKDESLRGEYKHPEFNNAYNKAKKLQRDFLVDNALAGLTPPASFIFVATNITDMTNKASLDHTSKGKPLELTMVTYVDEVNKKANASQSLVLEIPEVIQ